MNRSVRSEQTNVHRQRYLATSLLHPTFLLPRVALYLPILGSFISSAIGNRLRHKTVLNRLIAFKTSSQPSDHKRFSPV